MVVTMEVEERVRDGGRVCGGGEGGGVLVVMKDWVWW